MTAPSRGDSAAATARDATWSANVWGAAHADASLALSVRVVVTSASVVPDKTAFGTLSLGHGAEGGTAPLPLASSVTWLA